MIGGVILKSAKRILLFVLVISICISFCGCRVRTTKISPSNDNQITNQESVHTLEQEQDIKPDEKQNDELNDTNPTNPPSESVEYKKISSSSTQKKKGESPDKINTNASNDDSEDASGDIHNEDQSGDSNHTDLEQIDTTQQDTAMQIKIKYYQDLMSSNNSTQYECQYDNMYFESKTDYKSFSIYDTDEQEMIDFSGGRNIAEHSVSVLNSDWFYGKDINIIVKVVDKAVLGEGISSTIKAQQIIDEIMSRPNFDDLSAVREQKLLLISESLLETKQGRTLAELYMANMMYPGLYASYDFDSITQELIDDTDSLYVYYM